MGLTFSSFVHTAYSVLVLAKTHVAILKDVSFFPLDDHSRVKLENSENDYINASLVMVEEAERAYILSQVWMKKRNDVSIIIL